MRRAAGPRRLASVVEDRQIELAEACGVGEYVDFDDLPARDREAEYDTRSSAGSPHGPSGSVHECQLSGPGTPQEGVGHGPRTSDLS